MMNATTIMMARELANGLRDGSITAEAVDTELSVGPLADPSGPACYPETVIRFRRGEDVVAEVGCWVLGEYMRGPNRRDNGEYIGPGWTFLNLDGDGACSGLPRPTVDGDTVTFSGDNTDPALTLTLSGDEDSDEADVETIRAAIESVYANIDVYAAEDEEVASTLEDQKQADEIDVEVGGETISVLLFAGNDAGRTVYTFAGSKEVWEDAEECVHAAVEHLATILDGATRKLRSLDLTGTVGRMERRAKSDD
jgi:hypothetical protein